MITPTIRTANAGRGTRAASDPAVTPPAPEDFQSQLDAQQAQIAALQTQNNAQQAQIDAQQSSIASLQSQIEAQTQVIADVQDAVAALQPH